MQLLLHLGVLGERSVRAHLRRVVRIRREILVRQRQLQQCLLHLDQLHREGIGVVRQFELPRDVLHPLTDVGETVRRHIREQVVLDLVVEVAGEDRQQLPTLEVRRAEHLPQVPLVVVLRGVLLLGERLRLVGEVSAEDHQVRPHTADPVGERVRGDRVHIVGTGQRREHDVVLDHLTLRLVHRLPEADLRLVPALLAREVAAEFHVIERDGPLEQGCQHDVRERLERVLRGPLAVTGDPQDAVSHVVVHADDVGVLVVHVVVGVHPLGGRAGHVPFPGGGVDLGVVHPVPLSVDDVVPDLHVLEDLGDREHSAACPPQWFLVAEQQCRPAGDLE